MAERLPRYRPLGVRIPGVPSVNYAQTGRAQAQVFRTLGASIDRMSSFAYERKKTEAQIEGAEYGVANAPTPEQIKVAAQDPEKQVTIPGDKQTVFGLAARRAAIETAQSKITTATRNELTQLRLQAEQGDMPITEFQTKVQDVIDGYGQALQDISPTAAVNYRANITASANSSVLAYAEGLLAKQEKMEQSETDLGINNKIYGPVDEAEGLSSIDDVFAAGSTITANPDDYVGIAQKLSLLRTEIANDAKPFGSTYLGQKLGEFDSRVSLAMNDAISDWVMRDPVAHRRELRTGDIRDARIKDLWKNNMTSIQQSDALSAANKALKDDIATENAILGQQEAQDKIKASAAYVDLVDALLENDNVTIQNSLNTLRDTDPERYEKAQKAVSGGDTIDDASIVAILERNKINLRLTEQQVINAWTDRNISLATFKSYLGSVRTMRDDTFKAAAKIARLKLGLPERPLFNASKVQREAERELASVIEKLERKKLLPSLPDDFDPVAFVDAEIRIVLENRNKATPQQISIATQRAEEVRGKLNLPQGATIQQINDALASSNNQLLIDKYEDDLALLLRNQ